MIPAGSQIEHGEEVGCLAGGGEHSRRAALQSRDFGCYIIVDKFGSGYGDLEKILSLPVMQVNIDSSVLRSAAESEDMKKVAQGIVNLFHDISIFVCATGILTRDDMEMAESLGCDYLIGDYLCAPIKDSSYVNFIDAYFDEG